MNAREQQLGQIRDMVRSMLKDALPDIINTAASSPDDDLQALICKTASAGGGVLSVHISNDDDLQNFTRALATAADHASVRQSISEGKTRFELLSTQADTIVKTVVPSAPSSTSARRHMLDSGFLNEREIAALAKNYDEVEVGSRVVLTPLARDKARVVGLKIVRKGT